MAEESYRLALMTYFRRSRMRAFERMFRLGPQTRILDVGGTRFNWSLIAARPRITMVNVEGETGAFGHIEMRRGDATKLDFADASFDIVYSNSVIEHVGDRENVAAYAAHVRRLAPRYYVQTPNKWFPVEPHCMGLVLHWFPFRLRRRLYRWLSVNGWRRRPSQERIDRHLSGIRLLDEREARRLFPDAVLLKERTWLFPFVAKSFVLVRGADLQAARVGRRGAARPSLSLPIKGRGHVVRE